VHELHQRLVDPRDPSHIATQTPALSARARFSRATSGREYISKRFIYIDGSQNVSYPHTKISFTEGASCDTSGFFWNWSDGVWMQRHTLAPSKSKAPFQVEEGPIFFCSSILNSL
jgi:hypothetical protein